MVGNIISRFIFAGYIAASIIMALIYPNLLSRRRTAKSHPFMQIVINIAVLLDIAAIIVFIARPNLLAFEMPAIITVYSLLAVSLGYYFTVIRPIPNDDIMHFSDQLVLVANDRNLIIYANLQARKILGKDGKTLIYRPVSSFIPQITLADTQHGEDTTQEIELDGVQYMVRAKTDTSKGPGIKIIFLTDLSPAVQARTRMEEVEKELTSKMMERTEELEKSNAVLHKEIRDHKLSEQKLKSSLEEKNVLLNEVHHRVKNNLQVIISLLTLQKKYISDENTLDIFQTAIHRIRSMAMIHERLYKSDSLSNADFSEYLDDLVRHLVLSYKNRKDAVSFSVTVENIYLDIDTSITCGLIINELIVNILKHAFPEKQKDCKIELSFTSGKQDEHNDFGTGFSYCLEIRDNGKGFSKNFDFDKTDSYGFKIVKTLVIQLKGMISVENNGGTVVRVEF